MIIELFPTYSLFVILYYFFHFQVTLFESSYKSIIYLCFNKHIFHPSPPIFSSSVLNSHSLVSNDSSRQNFTSALEFTPEMASIFLHHLFLMALNYSIVWRCSNLLRQLIYCWWIRSVLFCCYRQCCNECPCIHFKCTVKVNVLDKPLDSESLFGADYLDRFQVLGNIILDSLPSIH